MKIKLEITNELKHKFGILMGNQLGKVVTNPNIEDLGKQYQFRFGLDGGSWHFELDKNSFEGGNHFLLHCSYVKMNIPIHYIKDLRMFCAQIAKIKEMQMEYVIKR